MPLRPAFDPSREFVAARDFVYHSVDYAKGKPFPKEGLTDRQLRQQYDTRAINFADPVADKPDYAAMVTMTNTNGSWYEISAPWLEQPVKVNGKANAKTDYERARRDGPPEGWEPPAA